MGTAPAEPPKGRERIFLVEPYSAGKTATPQYLEERALRNQRLESMAAHQPASFGLNTTTMLKASGR